MKTGKLVKNRVTISARRGGKFAAASATMEIVTHSRYAARRFGVVMRRAMDQSRVALKLGWSGPS